MWNDIITEEDVQTFMEEYGGFHDSCLSEMTFHSGMAVSPDLEMKQEGSSDARCIFQRQYNNPKIIEVEFHGIKHIHIPVQDDFLLIDEAHIKKIGDLWCWMSDRSFRSVVASHIEGTSASARGCLPFMEGEAQDCENPEASAVLCIAAERMRWRVVSEGER